MLCGELEANLAADRVEVQTGGSRIPQEVRISLLLEIDLSLDIFLGGINPFVLGDVPHNAVSNEVLEALEAHRLENCAVYGAPGDIDAYALFNRQILIELGHRDRLSVDHC